MTQKGHIAIPFYADKMGEATQVKFLLMCYECSPYIGSEWAVGWGRLLGAAKLGDTHVVTSEENYRGLERARAEGLLPRNVTIHTPEPDAKLRALEQTPGVFAYNYKAYNHWQKLAMAYVQKLHAQERFDLAHQVNVCTFREPGYTLDLGIPFLWGPVGGTQNFPAQFLSTLPLKEAVKEGVRGVANRITLRRSRVRDAARRAAFLIAANSTNKRDFEAAFQRDVELLLETGLHDFPEPNRSRFHARVFDQKHRLSPAPIRLLWSGELHTRKALPVLLRALAQLAPTVAWQLDVLGDGPMRWNWSDESAALGLKDRVRFLGRQSFSDAVAEMQTAHLFCFTSLRDTSGNVILEALAAGVPVICFDHQGAGDIVNDSCGVKIPVRSPKQAYKDWARAIATLANEPDRLLALNQGATQRAREFLWSHNHDRINAIYQRLAPETPRRSEAASPTLSRLPAMAAEEAHTL